MTVLDIITRGMRLLGALGVADNAPTAQESADGFAVLNDIVDAWATERLMMYTTARTVYPVTAGVQQYLLGPNTSGTDWQGARPMYLDGAGLILPGTPISSERPLHIIRTDDEWAKVRAKGVPSNYPTAIYMQSDYPAATIVLWPAPTVATQVALYTPSAVSQFTSLTQTISLPPGYARTLRYNFAVEYAAEFGLEPSPTVVAIAQQSKDSLKRANVPNAIGRLKVDPALRGRGGAYNVYIDEAR